MGRVLLKCGLLILFTGMLSVNAQSYVQYNPVEELAGFEKERLQMQRAGVKSLSIYKYRSEKQRKGRLVKLREYDTNGNLTYQRAYDTTFFYYNTRNQVIKILEFGFYDAVTEVDYDSNNRVERVLYRSGWKEIPPPDTFTYTYKPDGQLHTKKAAYYNSKERQKPQVFYYHHTYKCFGYFTRTAEDTVPDFSLTDSAGYMIQIYDEHDEGDFVFLYDSMCNRLHYIHTEKLKRGVTKVAEGYYKYDSEGRLTEEKDFHCPRNYYEDCTGRLTFSGHSKYEYESNGLLVRETRYSKHGRVVAIFQYVYETYESKQSHTPALLMPAQAGT